MLDILNVVIAGIGATGVAVTSYIYGATVARREERRQHGATAQCAACSWESDRLPLAAAFDAAAAHTATPAGTATERHRGFVVKA